MPGQHELQHWLLSLVNGLQHSYWGELAFQVAAQHFLSGLHPAYGTHCAVGHADMGSGIQAVPPPGRIRPRPGLERRQPFGISAQNGQRNGLAGVVRDQHVAEQHLGQLRPIAPDTKLRT